MRSATDKPNVLLVNCDDLGFGDLGCYGSAHHDTPGLDRLARRGIRFTDFYQGSPVCSPSRACMLTGCYPPRVGMELYENRQRVLFPGDPVGLSTDEDTIASALKRAGYATCMIGKWHVGDQPAFLPTRHGFDRYFGLPYSNDMGRQAGDRPEFPPLPLVEGERVIEVQPDQASLTERYVEHAKRFIHEHRDGPFFLYLAHLHVHLPHYTPDVFLRASRNGRYGAAVSCIDWAMRALLHQLETLGLTANTIVIFTSDNGSRARGEGGSNAPLRGTKGTTWEGGLRVPLIVSWAGQFAGGAVCTELAAAMDLLPTLARLCDAEPRPAGPIDGVNISPLLERPNSGGPIRESFVYYDGDHLDALRLGDHKLHLRTNELYDLRADIGEQHNCLETNADLAGHIRALAAQTARELGDSATGEPGDAKRPCGRVKNAAPLAEYDPDHPYLIEMYDLPHYG